MHIDQVEEVNKIIYNNRSYYHEAQQLMIPEVPLFSFKALKLPKESLKHANAIPYAKNLITYKLTRELVNGVDIRKRTFEYNSGNCLYLKRFVEELKSNPKYINVGGKQNNTFRIGDSIDPTNAYHILLVTSWRSGSTFLGELLSRYPGVFYSFEPLRYIRDKYNNTLPDTVSSIQTNLLSQLFKCQPKFGFFIHAKGQENQSHRFMRNFRLWNVCKNIFASNLACFIPKLYYLNCPLFPIRVIKTVMLRVQAAQKLLMDPKLNATLKIVVLVRDPRGFMNSRTQVQWCNFTACNNPTVACNDLQSDVMAAYEIKKNFPGKFAILFNIISI